MLIGPLSEPGTVSEPPTGIVLATLLKSPCRSIGDSKARRLPRHLFLWRSNQNTDGENREHVYEKIIYMNPPWTVYISTQAPALIHQAKYKTPKNPRGFGPWTSVEPPVIYATAGWALAKGWR